MDINDTVRILSGSYVALREIPVGTKDGYYYICTLNNKPNTAQRNNGQPSELWDYC